jgi:hypothetical protein
MDSDSQSSVSSYHEDVKKQVDDETRLVHLMKLFDTRCIHGSNCVKRFNCKYLHTIKEKNDFMIQRQKKHEIARNFRKTKLCVFAKAGQHCKKHEMHKCPYSHSEKGTYCLTCKSYGHLTSKCPSAAAV